MSELLPLCPFCYNPMVEVGIDEVPVETFQANLTLLNVITGTPKRLKESVEKALTGWYWCRRCGEYNHHPTLKTIQSFVTG